MTAPPSVAVTIAGPITNEAPVSFPASHPVVAKCDFFGVWASAPPASKTLSMHAVIKAYFRRCSISRNPADQAAARLSRSFSMGFTAATITRVVDELVASGLLNVNFAAMAELDAAIDSLVITNPNNLLIVASDWRLGEALVAPPAPAGGRGRGRAARGAAAPPLPPAPAPPPALAYLDTLSLVDLEVSGPAPFAVTCAVAGAFGPCLTRAGRDTPGSQIRSVMASLSPALRKSCNLDAGDDGARGGEARV